MSNCIRCALSLAVISWIVPSNAIALAVDWKANVDGNFNDGTKWSSGAMPGSGDMAQFSQGAAAAYTVTFPGDLIFNPTRIYTNDQLVVADNDVTFVRSALHQLGPAKYALSSSTTAAGGARGIVVGGGTAAILETSLVNLSAAAATIGNTSFSTGTMIVNGGVVNVIGSTADTELFVGYHGKGALSINNGGQLNLTGDAGDVLVGDAEDGLLDVLDNSVNISGTGSLLSVQGGHSNLNVRKGSLGVAAGGQLSTSGAATISPKGIVTVNGAGSTWVATGSGIAMQGALSANAKGMLNVTGGGLVTTTQMTCPQAVVKIDGAGSTVNTGFFGSATFGFGNGISSVVTLTQGAQMFAPAADIGFGSTSIDGIGSKWTTSGDMTIENNANLVVGAGGQLVTGNTYITTSFLSSTSHVSIDGTGSKWTTSGVLGVGVAAQAQAFVSVTNGAQASTASGILGQNSGGTGTITVDGGGSTLTTSGDLTVGMAGIGNLNITGTGKVSDTNAVIGDTVGSNGTVIVDGAASTWTLSGNLKVGDAGTAMLTARNGGGVSASGNVTIGTQGTLTGNGTVAATAVQNSGVISPGNSLGVLQITGNYTQTAAGKLQIELAGTSLGSQYDQLLAIGSLTLSGTLQVLLTNGFTPTAGNSFNVLGFQPDSVTGSFSTVNLPTLGAGMSWNISQLYSAGNISVVGPVPGDYNGNGIVDAADYTIWRKTLGSVTNLQANGDNTGASAGKIDQADYNIWRANFAAQNGSGSSANGATVPEPETLVLAVVGMILISVSAESAAGLRISFSRRRFCPP